MLKKEMATPESKETQYTWTQTQDSLTLFVPMKRIHASKVDVYLSDLFAKVNAPSIKLILALDLYREIEYTSHKTRTQMREDGLELYLIKAKAESWPQLCFVDTKENLRKRREESMAREKKLADEKAKIAEKKKIDMDQLTLNESIALEDAQRKAIRSRKDEDKLKAEQDLYDSLEKIEADQPVVPSQHTPLIEDISADAPAKGEIRRYEKPAPGNAIFTENDFRVAKVRPSATVKVTFTEKKYPLLATRETQLKEPPLPKNLQQIQKKERVYISFWITASRMGCPSRRRTRSGSKKRATTSSQTTTSCRR